MIETYEFALKIETDRAWGVYEEDPSEVIWLPKHRVERGRLIRTVGLDTVYEFSVPEDLAIEKGLA